MEDYFRKSKRCHSIASRPFPPGPLPPVPRARVPAPTPESPRGTAATADARTIAPNNATRPSRAPRKRFRKKVTGLFGDQTDLHKRMQKLLRNLPDDILSKRPVKTTVTDTSPVYFNPINGDADDLIIGAGSLDLAKKVVDKMGAVKKIAGGAMRGAKKSILAIDGENENRQESDRDAKSSAKWKNFQDKFGRLSPRSTDMFLNEVNVGIASPPASTSKVEVKPPQLPSLEDVRESPVTAYIPSSVMCRIGTPALLRRKVRRNERGYRGADVLRMRMSRTLEHGQDGTACATQRDDAISPAMVRGEGGLDVYVRSLGGEVTREMGTRRGRSGITEPSKLSATKRRISEHYQTEGQHQDPLALLIEAAEKESGQAVRRTTDEELPPRKAKRLRGSGWVPDTSNDLVTHTDLEGSRQPAALLGTAAPRRTRAPRNMRAQVEALEVKNSESIAIRKRKRRLDGALKGSVEGSEDSAATADDQSEDE